MHQEFYLNLEMIIYSLKIKDQITLFYALANIWS